ncbi:MAG: UDP-N-acetylmuramate dehydrogenase [Bradymonadia bacterium]|jgi:UDP-N-acetylmuramate dehydrogenase
MLPSYSEKNVPLSRKTTLSVGGSAGVLASPLTEKETIDTYRALKDAGTAVFTLGGGSNVLVADAGWDGTVVQSNDYAMKVRNKGDYQLVEAAAGIEWDELVAFCVDDRLAGIECLSGIPGRVGAAPIQNIGAYGQEIAEAVEYVRVYDHVTDEVITLNADECGFGYRTSNFKTAWRSERIVLSLGLRLRKDGEATVRYPELRRALGVDSGIAPPIKTVRETVLRIRRRKSMVYDTGDTNHRSAGSFFTNPLVDAAVAAEASDRAKKHGIEELLPQWETGDHVKLSAAWLIEQTGFERGFTFGKAGLSTKHCLALINRGDATASGLIALASLIRKQVRARFGVELVPEPTFIGFDRTVDELLG